MQARLALFTLARHPVRTGLTILGVAVATAMLLDMVMLGSGMKLSFQTMLEGQGFAFRLTPRGTMPFDTDALLGNADALAATAGRDPDVVRVSQTLGTKLHVLPRAGATDTSVVTGVGMGLDRFAGGEYDIVEGSDLQGRPDALVLNDRFLATLGAAVGDTLDVAVGWDPQLRRFSARRRLVIVGRGNFRWMASDQRAAALDLRTAQALGGPDRRDRVSVVMVDTRPGADLDAVQARLERALPQVSAISIAGALAFMEERLAYFRQLAFILASVALAVGFALVATLMAASVSDRLGEIAVLRALGVSRWHIVQQVLIEGFTVTAVGALLGLGLGLFTADWLNSILKTFPGLPAGFDFFLFEPSDAWQALGLLVISGALAAIQPAWRAATLPIAHTLRTEAVA